MAPFQFSDYDGPTGFYVATGAEMLSVSTAEGASAFVSAAAHSGLGSDADAAKLEAAKLSSSSNSR